MITREKHDRMANAIRFLSMDAVEKANSGHPGLPMGAADIATVLFTRFLKFDPKAPHWPDRDRFVLSAGHGSMLLYSLLYLTGYEDMTIDEIKHFRQLGSKTAGHPEYGHAAGIETTTGPLGQGLANSVGMAIAERMLERRNSATTCVDHHTYVLAGDGCLMEGISQEAIALAGHLKLNKLIVFWDDNNISIDGAVSLAGLDRPDRPLPGRPAGTRSASTATIRRRSPAAIEAAQQVRQADLHRLQDRPSASARRTRPAPTRFMARRSAPRKSPAPARRSAGTAEPSTSRPTFSTPGAQPASAPLTHARTGKAAWPRPSRQARPSSSAASRGDLPGDFDAAIAAYKKKLAADKPKVATRKASEDGARSHQRRAARDASAARPT